MYKWNYFSNSVSRLFSMSTPTVVLAGSRSLRNDRNLLRLFRILTECAFPRKTTVNAIASSNVAQFIFAFRLVTSVRANFYPLSQSRCSAQRLSRSACRVQSTPRVCSSPAPWRLRAWLVSICVWNVWMLVLGSQAIWVDITRKWKRLKWSTQHEATKIFKHGCFNIWYNLCNLQYVSSKIVNSETRRSRRKCKITHKRLANVHASTMLHQNDITQKYVISVQETSTSLSEGTRCNFTPSSLQTRLVQP